MSCRALILCLAAPWLAASATAQFGFTMSRMLPSTPHIEMAMTKASIEVSEGGQGDQWIAEVPGTEVYGGASQALGNGCITLGQPGTIQRPNEDGSGPLPRQIVARTGDPVGPFSYHGLFLDGTRWITSPSFTNPPEVTFTDPYAILDDRDTGDLYLFEPCEKRWMRVPAGRNPSIVHAGSTALVVQQGDTLIGVSLRSSRPVRLTGLGQVRFRPGTGSPGSLLAFEDTTGDLHIFAAYTETWISVPIASPSGVTLLAYGDATLLIGDGNNRLVFVSAITGSTKSMTTASVSRIVQLGDFRAESHVVTVVDRSSGLCWVYRPIDNGLSSTGVTLATPGSGCQACATSTLFSANDWAGVRSGNRFSVVSGMVSGAGFAQLVEPDRIVCCDRGATSLLLVTATSVHAYSAIVNGWTSTSYAGPFLAVKCDDHVAYVHTETEVIAFSPRLGAFTRVPVSRTATVVSDDSVMLVRDGGIAHAFGADSNEFRSQAISRTPTLVRVEDEYAIVIERHLLGSRLRAFTRAADTWFEIQTTAPFTTATRAHFADRQALLEIGNNLARLSAFSDISSCRDWPSDRTALLRPIAGTGTAPFVAEGPPSAALALIVGSRRARLPVVIPGVLGALQVEPAGVFAVIPIGGLSATGTVCFDVPLPRGGRAELFFQNIVLLPTGAAIGQLYTYRIQ